MPSNPYGSPQKIPTRGGPFMRSMPRTQFDRSVDPLYGAPRGGGGGGGIIPPLWLESADSTHLSVRFGTVNGIIPSGGWAGGGDDVGVNVDISGYTDGTYNIYVHCTLGSDGIPTAVEVLSSTSAVPTDDSGNSYRLNSRAVIASGAVFSIQPDMAWAQEFVTCGRDSADPSTIPGTYYWELA